MSIKKTVFIGIGCVCLALGTAGIFLPILPTTPFYIVTAYCFARSSKLLNDWFKRTKLYKKHLESYANKEGMLRSTKAGILVTVTIVMGIGFFFMARDGLWFSCIILSVIWIAHMIYFLFLVKSILD